MQVGEIQGCGWDERKPGWSSRMIGWELLALEFSQFPNDKWQSQTQTTWFSTWKLYVHDIVDGRLVGQLLDTLVAGRISRMEATGRWMHTLHLDDALDFWRPFAVLLEVWCQCSTVYLRVSVIVLLSFHLTLAKRAWFEINMETCQL